MKVHFFRKKEKNELLFAGYPAIPHIRPDTGYPAKSVSGATLLVFFLIYFFINFAAWGLLSHIIICNVLSQAFQFAVSMNRSTLLKSPIITCFVNGTVNGVQV